MNRGSSRKVLACAVCGESTLAGAEAERVLCDKCAAAGRDFPRARQLDLFELPVEGKRKESGSAG